MSIFWLEEPAMQTTHQLGTKVATWNTPPGFVVTTQLVNPAALMAAYDELGRRMDEVEPPVRVRPWMISGMIDGVISGAIEGKHPTPPFADQPGIHQVRGVEAVAKAIARGWKATRSLAYYPHADHTRQPQRLAILVQALAPADVTVAIASTHSIYHRGNEPVVTAGWRVREGVGRSPELCIQFN